MSSTLRRLPRPRRLWIVALVVVVLLAALAVFAAASSSAAPQYRTAVATSGDVTAALAASGALQPLDRADAAFPVSGTVATVPVALGQHVTPGTVLATLDTTALDAQVASAQSQQATAEAKLAADRSGQAGTGSAAGVAGSGGGRSAAQSGSVQSGSVQPGSAQSGSAQSASAQSGSAPARTAAGRTSGAASTGGAPSGGTAPSGGPAASPDPASGQAVEQAAAVLTRALATREDDQRTADAALATARTALATATATCGPAPEPGDPAADGTDPAGGGAGPAADPAAERAADPAVDPAADPAAGTAHTATGTGPYRRPATHRGAGSGEAACRAALGTVLAEQTTVSRLQTQVSADDKVLDTAIPTLVTAALGMLHAKVSGGLSAPAPPRTATAPAAAAPGGRAAAPAARVSTPASSEQLDADQAAVDAAAAQVTLARQNRDQATLTSPIEGTVGSVGLTVGQRVGGGTAAQIVVIGSGRAYQAQVSVSEADVARIAVGDQASVTPDGAGAPVAGTVSSIALLPDAAASGAAVTYPVTIALPGVTGPYPAGQGATVSIRLAEVRGVLTVPTSAVHTAGTRHTVDVLRGGRSQPVPVQVGAVGPGRTEIVSGLGAGDVVVVADPSLPLPSTGLTGLRGIGGGRPGG